MVDMKDMTVCRGLLRVKIIHFIIIKILVYFILKSHASIKTVSNSITMLSPLNQLEKNLLSFYL